MNPQALEEEGDSLPIKDVQRNAEKVPNAYFGQKLQELFVPGMEEKLSPTIEQEEPLGYARVSRITGVFEIADTSTQTIAFNKSDFNNGIQTTYGIWGSDFDYNYRFDIVRGGTYEITVVATMYVGVTLKSFWAGILKNGIEVIRATNHGSLATALTVVSSDIMKLQRGDYIQAFAGHASGSVRSLAVRDTYMTIHQIA